MILTEAKPEGCVRSYDAFREVTMGFFANDKDKLSIWISRPGCKSVIRLDVDLKKKNTRMETWWQNVSKKG